MILAQAPNGYTYCAGENESFVLPAKSHIAYGADNRYKYLFNQKDTVIFNNDFFGGDPIFGVGKSGYYKIADGKETPAVLSAAMLKIKNHITGTKNLSPKEINVLANTIQQNIFVIADSATVVLDAFAMVDCYEKFVGPIFINSSTLGGFPNDFGADDGFELVRAVFIVQQGIMDYVYTPKNIENISHFSLVATSKRQITSLAFALFLLTQKRFLLQKLMQRCPLNMANVLLFRPHLLVVRQVFISHLEVWEK